MVWRLWADEMQTDANHLQVGALWGGVFWCAFDWQRDGKCKNRFAEYWCEVNLKSVY